MSNEQLNQLGLELGLGKISKCELWRADAFQMPASQGINNEQ